MADEDATLRHSNSVNSEIDLRQTASNVSQTLSSHDETERSISHDREHLDPDIHNRLWTPFFLRRFTLFSFIAFYLLIAASIVVLVVIDRAQQGLASARTSQHYLWTYGPTAILTPAATLWGQVEYRAKQVMPWAVLRTSPTKASETLFIDYVSINQISALRISFRAGHIPVALSVIGSLLIKLVIIMSTSLLILQEQPWTIRNVPVNSTEIFSSNVRFEDDAVTLWDTVGLSLYNAPYPPGTSTQQAVPNLDLGYLHLGDNDIIEANMPSFNTNLHCEIAENISVGSDIITKYGSHSSPITFDTPSCHFKDRLPWYDGAYPGSPNQYHFISHVRRICNATGNQTLDRARPRSDARYIIYAGYLRPNTSEFLSYTAKKDQHATINMSNVITALQCELTYNLTSSSAMINSRQTLLSLPSPTGVPILGNHTARLDMASFFEWIEGFEFSSGSELLDSNIVHTEGIYSDRSANDTITGFITMLAFEKVQRIGSLLDPNVLEATFKHFVQAVAAQMAKRNFFMPGTEELEASIHTTQKRLRTRDPSMYSMLATLAALIIITAVLCAVAPQNIASRDTDSVGGFSTILSRSANLSTYFRGTGCVQLATIQDSMGTRQCESYAANTNGRAHFVLDLYEEDGPQERFQDSDDSTKSVKWWRPFAISAAYKSAVVLFIISIIITLEILYQQSRIHNGLANVSNDGALRYTWLYTPAITMTAIQLLVGTIGSTSNLIFPYHEMRLWPSGAKRALAKNLSCRLTIDSLFTSVHQRHWAIIATSLSLLLNPFLTIISAGLFTAESIPRTGRMQLQINDTLFSKENQRQWADIDIPERYLGEVNFMTPHLIDGTIPYPLWTHHGLVFPRVSMLAKDTANNRDMSTFSDNQTTIMVPLNGLRSSLGCTPSPNDRFNLTIHYVNETFDMNYDHPDGVHNWKFTRSFFKDKPWVGETTSFDDGSMRILYGWLNDTSTVHMATCYGFVEEIQVDVTFALPSFSVLDVMADEESAHRLENGSAPLYPLDNAVYPAAIFNTPNILTGAFNQVFLLMLDGEGTHAFTMNDIMGENGLPKLVETLQYYWRIIYPQLLNLASRKEIQGELPVIDGRVTQSDRYRLQQSGISTRILEVLLGIIAACVAVSFWAMNTKEILPNNPCSIAAQASLLSGSGMLRDDVLPPGSEWLSDKELLEKGVFDGLLFSMGWRGGADGEKRWFGIDVGRSDWSR